MPEKKQFKYGAVVEMNQDFSVESTEGMTFDIKKGELAVVGFDNYIHYMDHNLVEEINPETVELKGISPRGLSNYITTYLDANMNLEAMLKEHDMDGQMFADYIAAAFENIGLPDDMEEIMPTEETEEENE